MRILDFFRDDTMFYAKFVGLYCRLHFSSLCSRRQRIRCAHARCFVAGFSSAVSLAGQITFIFNLFMGGLRPDEHPGCSLMERAIRYR